MVINAIKNFISIYLDMYYALDGIQRFIFVFFTMCVILFWVFYFKALYILLKTYITH